MWQEKGLLLIAKLLLPPQLRLVTPHIWREQQVQVRWKLLNVWIIVLALRIPRNIFIDTWLYATSVPKDVAWASRRDLLLCADTEEM